MTIRAILESLPDGYSEVSYDDRRWGMTVERFNEGKSLKLFARELGGQDFVSLNFYVTGEGEHLKPCEMPEQKVVDFLNALGRDRPAPS